MTDRSRLSLAGAAARAGTLAGTALLVATFGTPPAVGAPTHYPFPAPGTTGTTGAPAPRAAAGGGEVFFGVPELPHAGTSAAAPSGASTAAPVAAGTPAAAAGAPAAVGSAPVAATAATAIPDGMPNGRGSYEDLVALWTEFLEWTDPERARGLNPKNDVAGLTTDVYPDYGTAAVEQRRERMRALQARLADMGVARWTRSQQVDWLAVRAKFDEHDFTLSVSRPWSRDPGFYADQMLRITFTTLPVRGDALREVRRRLQAIPKLVEQAERNLTEGAADLADLALHNLTSQDGVNHGFPYREVPPAGVVGWYADLLARVEKQQPELRRDVLAAKRAVEQYRDWLVEKRPTMTAQAGVGAELFDWYVKHVKLMPYTSEQMLTLGTRELQRLWALYAIEQHRNRRLPPLELSKSAEEYRARIAATDAHVREYLRAEEIVTIPPFIRQLSMNVPWIVRKSGPNFWEQIQYRDPSPDHVHAVIPGHSFDDIVERANTHPIRGKISDGVRVEGWGVYLEEAMLHAGMFAHSPRINELIYLFGIFRAVRVNADIWLQTNRMKVDEVVKYWMNWTPYLDRDVARVDAEIYLRRPPGYGLGYMIGMIQMQQLLADVKHQQGDAFVLRDFHDRFLAVGRLPMSLVRYEMTGLDDEVQPLWKREPMPVRR
ncbi:MAG: DUF885 family protein [Pseudomonadota bacterium]